jgi:uncharacterized protein
MRIVLLTPIVALLLAAGVYLLTPQATLDLEAPGRGYVDAHAYIAGTGAGGSGAYIHPDLLDSFRYGYYLRGFGVTRKELGNRGDELLARQLERRVSESVHVRTAVILALDGVVRNDEIDRAATLVHVPNDFVARMARRYPSLKFGASVHPHRSDWRERLVEAKRNGAVLVKWLPALMDIDPADRRYRDFYRTLVELKLPLMVGVGRGHALADTNDDRNDPARLALPLSEGVTVIAAHAGTGGHYQGQPSHERLLSMFEDYPNLYADIAGLTQINRIGDLAYLLTTPAAERLLYGSSWPLQFFPLVSPFFHWPDVDLSTAKTIQNIENELDRDVALKRALGVPLAVFERSGQLLRQ